MKLLKCNEDWEKETKHLLINGAIDRWETNKVAINNFTIYLCFFGIIIVFISFSLLNMISAFINKHFDMKKLFVAAQFVLKWLCFFLLYSSEFLPKVRLAIFFSHFAIAALCLTTKYKYNLHLESVEAQIHRQTIRGI